MSASTSAALNSAVSTSGVSARLRLTRRGRVVCALLVTCVGFGLFASLVALGSTQASASANIGGSEFGYVVVQPGASLWEVASEIDSRVDPRDLVAEIVRLNQLDGSDVYAGQPVAVPLRYANDPGVVSAADLGL
jgi:hypothetical protein